MRIYRNLGLLERAFALKVLDTSVNWLRLQIFYQRCNIGSELGASFYDTFNMGAKQYNC